MPSLSQTLSQAAAFAALGRYLVSGDEEDTDCPECAVNGGAHKPGCRGLPVSIPTAPMPVLRPLPPP